MPRTPLAGYELRQLTVPTNPKMCRDLQAVKRLERGMCRAIKIVCEESLDSVTGKLPRRQADAMDDQHVDCRVSPCVLVRGYHLPRFGKNARVQPRQISRRSYAQETPRRSIR